jgi:hypothetical protein
MSLLRSKCPRLALDSRSHARLQKRILERDGWRCQKCGSSRALKVHHLQARSLLGDDREENVTTLCAACHSICHRHMSLIHTPALPRHEFRYVRPTPGGQYLGSRFWIFLDERG